VRTENRLANLINPWGISVTILIALSPAMHAFRKPYLSQDLGTLIALQIFKDSV
jgi:hypothetical protein